jgi:5-methylcytosine-specific restriction endonuclease McrA
MQNYLWPNIDFSAILQTITNNHGTRYYNITTDSLVNSPTIKKMTNVSLYHKVVANKTDTNLFFHIIALLDNEDFLIPPEYISRQNMESPHESSSSTSDYEDSSEISLSSNKCNKPNISIRTHQSYDKSSKNLEKKLQEKNPEKKLQEKNPEKKLQIKIKSKNPNKRRNVPQKIRQMTWRTYIGDSMDGHCWCCSEDITFEKWQAGHVIPASKGGPDTVANLRPICNSCKLSMGTKNMTNLIRSHDLKGRGADEFISNSDSAMDNISDKMSSIHI